MNFRRNIFVLYASILLLSALAGQLSSAAPVTDVLARVHWLGLDRISADTNSGRFMNVWRLPQTTALAAQTLDKLSRWPDGGATNAASALLRPLLDDLVSSESCWELRAPTNLPISTSNLQVCLAIRLRADRARLWQTNLAAALADLTAVHPVPARNGWLLQQSAAPGQIQLFRAGGWTFVGWGPDTTDLLQPFADHIARAQSPAVTNAWLEADLDPKCLFLSLATINYQPSTINHFHLTATGEGGNVLARGTFDFSRPLELPLSSWEIPTNLIQQPLTSFTAVRGLAPWLATLPAWQKLEFTPPPDQAYLWSQVGAPFQTYFAAPLPGASNQVRQLADRLVRNANPWLATNAEGNFQWTTNSPGLIWNNALIISPYLIPVTVNHHDYVLGGLYPLTGGNPGPLPVEILRHLRGTTNLVYYQTEQTGPQVEDCFFISQLFRVVFHKAQLPTAAAATVWLKKIEPMLGTSTTLMTQTRPAQLDFTRQSTVGLNALELHLLADWLESPQFPRGLHTFLAPPDP